MPVHAPIRACIPALAALAAATAAHAETPPHDVAVRRSAGEGPPAPGEAAPARDAADPLAATAALDPDALVRAVLDRNPTVEAARQAWLAAAELPAQMRSLDDPMAGATLAPLSLADPAHLGAGVMARQMLPWPGKRALRGEVAQADAAAMRADLDGMRVELAHGARMALGDLYLADRAAAVVHHHLAVLDAAAASARAAYAAGRGSQQDALEAEVELGRMRRMLAMLGADRDVAAARVNALLHRPPAAALPPPEELPLPEDAPRGAPAPDAHPEVRVAVARARGADASARLAERERLPDFEVSGEYSSMWAMPEHRLMAGLAVTLPIWTDRRDAAERQARAEAARWRAERQARADRLAADAAAAARRIAEAKEAADILIEQVIPAVRARVQAARAGLAAGRNDFSTVLAAINAGRDADLDLHAARTAALRARADLLRARGQTGGPAAAKRQGGTP